MRLIDSVFIVDLSILIAFHFRKQLPHQDVSTKTVTPVHGIIWAESSILQTDINFRTTARLNRKLATRKIKVLRGTISKAGV